MLIDDGSTDASTEFALQYANKQPGKVCYLAHSGQQNRGVCASRNLGIRYARGEGIALLDVDDVWLPHKPEREVAILNSHVVLSVLIYFYHKVRREHDIKSSFYSQHRN